MANHPHHLDKDALLFPSQIALLMLLKMLCESNDFARKKQAYGNLYRQRYEYHSPQIISLAIKHLFLPQLAVHQQLFAHHVSLLMLLLFLFSHNRQEQEKHLLALELRFLKKDAHVDE